MKKLINLFGRGGTILIAIGCATLLVSLIPSARVGSFSGSGAVEGKTWQWRYESVLTPQQSLSVSVTANGTLKVYLLEVNPQTIYKWINETHPQSPTEPFQFLNEKYLIEFMEADPQTVVIQKETSNGETKLEYTPTKITNVTLIFHNPNPSLAEFDYDGSVLLTMAPKVKMQTLSQIIIPIGFALTLPWIINSYKMKKEKSCD